MAKQRDEVPFLMNNILEDDKDTAKFEINAVRSNIYSAPPAMNLYDYEELSKDLFNDEDHEKKPSKKKVTKPVASKIVRLREDNQKPFQPTIEQGFKQPEMPMMPMPFVVPQQMAYQMPPSFMAQQYYMQPYYYQYYQQYYEPSHYTYPKEPEMDIQQMLPRVNSLSKEKSGSRKVQNSIESASDYLRDSILDELMKEPLQLIKDQFGNYVFQKFFEVGSSKHQKRILEAMKGKIRQLSFNVFGCRVVQKAIEFLKNQTEQQQNLMAELKNDIVELVQDQNGNHVIQKCFQCFFPSKTDCIIDKIIKHIDKLAFHAYGCRVIQKFLENNKGDKLKLILKKLLEMVVPLCKCQFGNYIMQYIVEKGPNQQKNAVLSIVKDNFVSLSLDKFASNVVEKTIRSSNEYYRKEVLEILQEPTANDMIGLVVLAQGQYSNYVIQCMIEVGDSQTKNKIASLIKDNPINLAAVKESQYGRHVLSQLGIAR